MRFTAVQNVKETVPLLPRGLPEAISLGEDSARQALGSFICSGQADVLRGLRQPLNNPGVRQTLRHASRGSLVTHPA